MRPCPIGHAQTRAQVVRIGHAIQHQQQRDLAFRQLVEVVIQGMALQQSLDPGHHALVTVAATQLGQAQTIAGDDAHAAVLGALHELAHAHIAPAGIDMQFNNGLGSSFHAHTHRMETKNHFERYRHGLIIQPRPVRRLQWQCAVGSAG